MSIKISASILSGDFGSLAKEAKRIEKAGADSIHIDIMDGHFVPNFTMGPKAVEAISRSCKLFLDVHLMIYNPFDYIEKFIKAGANRITFHIEATEDVEDTLKYIRKCDVEAGLSFNPETSKEMVINFLDKCDQILLMSVHPGFSGQAFIPDVLEKISYIRGVCDKLKLRKGGKVGNELPPFDIQVDGGINLETGRQCVEAGATSLISGAYLFSKKDMKKGVDDLRDCGEIL